MLILVILVFPDPTLLGPFMAGTQIDFSQMLTVTQHITILHPILEEASPTEGPLATTSHLSRLSLRWKHPSLARWQHVEASSTLSLRIWPTSIPCHPPCLPWHSDMQKEHTASRSFTQPETTDQDPHRTNNNLQDMVCCLDFLANYNNSDPTVFPYGRYQFSLFYFVRLFKTCMDKAAKSAAPQIVIWRTGSKLPWFSDQKTASTWNKNPSNIW